MRGNARLIALALLASACKPAAPAATAPPPAAASSAGAHCDAAQSEIARAADRRARQATRTGRGFEQHLASSFTDRKVSWLMREDLFQKYVAAAGARHFGRCEGGACYLFVAPLATIRKAVAESMRDGKHDPAALGAALGLPAKSFEGPLRMMTLDLDATPVCARLPVEEDPGVWKCKSAEDRDCFQFGGYTSGGIPEAMVIDAPVSGVRQEMVP